MKPECAQAIKTAAGREVSKGELDGIEERINSSLRELARTDRENFLSMPLSERMVQATKLAKERALADVVQTHEATIREANIKAALKTNIDSVVPGKNGQLQALRHKINSVETRTDAIVRDAFSTTRGFDEAAGGKLLGLFMDPSQHDNIAAAMFKEASTPEAKEAGDTLTSMNERMAQRFKLAGNPLDVREDWVLPQRQDSFLVAKAGKEAWVEKHMGWIDPRQYVNSDGSYMTPDQIRGVLADGPYRSYSTDGANKRAEGSGSSGGGSSLVGSNENAPRRIFFKGSASYMAAMREFGVSRGNIYEMEMSHVRSMARDIAVSEMFGRNADANVREVLAGAYEKDQEAAPLKDRRSVENLSRKVQQVYDATVHPDRPGHEVAANIAAQTRGIFGSAQLGALVSAFVDTVGMHMAAEHNGLPAIRVWRNFLDGLTGGKETDAFLHRTGLVLEGVQHAITRSSADEFRSGVGTWANNTTHRLMMLNTLDRGLRSGMGRTALDILGSFTRKHETLAEADGSNRMLQKGGITEDHWATWRAAEVEKGRGNETLLTPEGIYHIPDAKIDPIVERRVAARSEIFQKEIDKRDAQIARLGDNPDVARVQEIRDAFQSKHDAVLSEERMLLKHQASEKLMEVAAQQQQFGARGAMRSSVEDSLAMGIDPRDAGTLKGEFWRFAMQFKSVPLGVFRQHFQAMNELNSVGAKAVYAAKFVGLSTLVGALSTELKAIINGQNPRNISAYTEEGRKFWLESICAGGGFGLYGDIFASDRIDGTGGLEALAGPGIGLLKNVVNEYSQARKDAFNDESKHSYALAGLRLVRQNATPFANIWYAKAAFNRLVYDQLQDQLSPGHSQQQTARMQSKGSSYWWAPGTTAPQSAPDMSQAYQDR